LPDALPAFVLLAHPCLTNNLALAASLKSARIGSDKNRGREKPGEFTTDTSFAKEGLKIFQERGADLKTKNRELRVQIADSTTKLEALMKEQLKSEQQV
jgi:hypothetical protein